MKHTIELKLPKLFGKKAKQEEKVNKEEEVTLETDNEKVTKALKIAAPMVAGIAVSYLVGYNKGMTNAIKTGSNVIVVK